MQREARSFHYGFPWIQNIDRAIICQKSINPKFLFLLDDNPRLLAVCAFSLFSWRFWATKSKSLLPKTATVIRKPFFYIRHGFDCRNLLYNISDQYTVDRPLAKQFDLWKKFGDCKALFDYHYYPQRPLTSNEENFPLAYVILVNEHLEQVEILFNSIYQPQNLYCFHIDLKSSLIFYSSIKRLASCFDNVFVVDRMVVVNPVSHSMILAQLECLKILTMNSPSISTKYNWQYVILLQGHDFPLKTNAEIVEILKIHDGANDVELINEIAWKARVDRNARIFFS
uniref:Uncharacterized protein n=1 Tax=Romanomermis culicivorax TaxID=13658 RepID=A0A915HVV1_ROMCU